MNTDNLDPKYMDAFNEMSTNVFHDMDVSEALLKKELDSRLDRPFSLVRVGDVEAMFAQLPYVSGAEKRGYLNTLYMAGINPNNLPSPKEFEQRIMAADIILSQTTNNPPAFWYNAHLMFKRMGVYGKRRIFDCHAIYTMTNSGWLFEYLKGKRVCVVGAKAKRFVEKYTTNESYKNKFQNVGIHKLDFVRYIETPDMGQHAMDHRSKIETDIRKTYREDIDVYLISAGLLAKYLAVMIKVEANKTAIDFGNEIEIMMGLRDDRGPQLCGPFYKSVPVL